MFLVKRGIHIGLVGLFALFLMVGIGAANAAPKIGVVDIATIMDESVAGREADALLRAFVAERQQVIDELELELEQLTARLNGTDDSTMRNTLQSEMDEKTTAFQQRVQRFEAEIEAAISELQSQILGDIQIVLELFGDDHDYDIIFDTASVVYLGPALDVTWEVIEAYDKLLEENRALAN